MRLENWTRREFVRGAAGVIAVPHLPHFATFAYATSGTDMIQIFRVQGKHRTLVQEIASAAPASIVRVENTLYVANDVAVFDRLPRGSVETFHIGADGRLTSLCRTALSLSATHPGSMAVSPDQTLLAVAAREGGIYNLFVIAEDGGLEGPCSIFKDVHCTHPETLTFDAKGQHLIASGAGNQMSVLAVDGSRNLIRRSASCLL